MIPVLICNNSDCQCFGDSSPSPDGMCCFLCHKPMSGYAPVGALVHCAYWGYVYRVVSHNDNGSVTVEQIPNHPMESEWCPFAGRERLWSHFTPLDVRDHILALPVTA